ncbi:PEGA domain-containing protein [bacterium]|nr:MAG: PEGA domain-containing protein [bacterium]
MDMTPMEILKQYRGVLVFIIVAAISIFAIITGFNMYQRSGKLAYTLAVAPSSSIVKLNDVVVKPGTQYLKPGTYKVTASHDGYTNFVKTVTVSEKSNETGVAIPLVPVTDEAIKWVREHKNEYDAVLSAAKSQDDRQTALLKSANPITEKMPFKNLLFGINYRPDPKDTTGTRILIEITASESYRSAALYQIRQWGYDPTDYRIQFTGYTSPFSS